LASLPGWFKGGYARGGLHHFQGRMDKN